MKHTDKKNNKPYINASVFFSFIFAAFVLFAVTVSKSTVYGTGDGAGPFIMGSGEGSGTGDGVGDGSLSGNIKGNASEALKGENPDAENTDNSPGKGDGKGEGEGKGDGAGGGEPPPPQEAEAEKGKDNSEQKAGNQHTAVNSAGRKNLPVARLYLAPDKDEEDKKPVKKVKPQKVVKTVEAPAKKVKLSDADGGGGSRSFSASSGGKSVFRIQKHKSILFIVDISGSMSTLASENQTRLSILQFQLKRTIREQHRQRSRGKYGIIAFSSPCYYFPDNSKNGQLSFNKVKDIDQTEAWIDSFEKLDRSSTNLFSAIQDGLDRIAKQGLEFDTIFILTDGEPTDVHDPKQYLKLLQDGLPKGISINTISIGTTSQLLKEIAQKYNGVYDEYK